MPVAGIVFTAFVSIIVIVVVIVLTCCCVCCRRYTDSSHAASEQIELLSRNSTDKIRTHHVAA